MAPPKKSKAGRKKKVAHLDGRRTGRPKRSAGDSGLTGAQLRHVAKLLFLETAIIESDADTRELLDAVRRAVERYVKLTQAKMWRDVATLLERLLTAAYRKLRAQPIVYEALERDIRKGIAPYLRLSDATLKRLLTVRDPANPTRRILMTAWHVKNRGGPAKLARIEAARVVIAQGGDSVRSRIRSRERDPSCYRPDPEAFKRWVVETLVSSAQEAVAPITSVFEDVASDCLAGEPRAS